jgi:hypothetical protein
LKTLLTPLDQKVAAPPIRGTIIMAALRELDHVPKSLSESSTDDVLQESAEIDVLRPSASETNEAG